ncbi:hypothetical protein FOA52_000385 [Chlamydomonas sp. UWO 241]|nr:hypothetical protein FOA52_000385 [Chlamydomonas sp. UWO 241]
MYPPPTRTALRKQATALRTSSTTCPPGTSGAGGSTWVAATGLAPIGKYLFLRDLRASDPSRFYELLLTHQEQVLPFIYTPTVGEACQRYHLLPLTPTGLYLRCDEHAGRVSEMLVGKTEHDVRVIVVTDGERILGLGDLGANGMGISEGKITLYTAAAGVDPAVCLPVCLDVGTNNQALLDDPSYKGVRQRRLTGPAYDAFVDEFMVAVRDVYPHCVIQFEDFGGGNAFRLIKTYRTQQCCFNDDIQGTAAITLAAVLVALRGLEGGPASGGAARDGGAGGTALLARQRFLFLGAGEAGTGIANLFAYCIHRRTGASMEAARRLCSFVDSKGLVCGARARAGELQPHKLPFAHNVPFCATLLEAVTKLRPTVLIGVSAVAGAFDEQVIRAMSACNHRPIIMPLSNPTSKAECTFEQAREWSGGRVVFASGSPFDPITPADGVVVTPAQANNVYIFPALGHAASLMRWSKITDEMFLLAAEALADMCAPGDASDGHLFPPFAQILDVSAHIMGRLISRLYPTAMGMSEEDATEWARAHMWDDGQQA